MWKGPRHTDLGKKSSSSVVASCLHFALVEKIPRPKTTLFTRPWSKSSFTSTISEAMDTLGAREFECQSSDCKWTLFHGKQPQEWKHEVRKTSDKTSNECTGDFSLLTLNKWSEGGHLAPIRFNGLLNSLAAVKADVVVLQEVTDAATKAMKRDKRFMKKWIVSSFSTEMHGR